MDVTIAGTSVSQSPTDDQLSRISIQLVAFDGTVGVGSYPIDDAAGTHDFKGDREFVVTENGTYLVDGFLTDQTRERGSQPAAPHRETVYTVLDPNALLYGFRVVRSRASETDVARVLAFAAADLPSFDTTWVLNSNTSTMTAKKYDTGEGWTDLITDTKELTGKTLFVHDKPTGGRCLHYHRLTSGHTCGLVISDVASAVNGVTTFAPQKPTRERSPADLINDLKVRDQAGRLYSTTDATSITDHDADGMRHENLVDVEAGSQAELTAKGTQILADSKDERFTYTCSIGPLDWAALLHIRVGDLITTTSAVMGLTATAERIAHMTLTPFTGKEGRPTPGLWNAELELGAPIRTGRRRRSSANNTGKPGLPAVDPTLIDFTGVSPLERQRSSTSGLFKPVVSWLVVDAQVGTDEVGNATGVYEFDPGFVGEAKWAADGSGTLAGPWWDTVYREYYVARWEWGDPGIEPAPTHARVHGVVRVADQYYTNGDPLGWVIRRVDAHVVAGTPPTSLNAGPSGSGSVLASGSIVPTSAGDIAVGVGTYAEAAFDFVVEVAGQTDLTMSFSWAPGDTTFNARRFLPLPLVYGTQFFYPDIPKGWVIGLGAINWGAPDGDVTIDSGFYVDLHSLGQLTITRSEIGRVEAERTTDGDGASTSFPTLLPYVAGTLRVTVNGVDNTDDITETDPDGREFTFTDPPLTGAEIYVAYEVGTG